MDEQMRERLVQRPFTVVLPAKLVNGWGTQNSALLTTCTLSLGSDPALWWVLGTEL